MSCCGSQRSALRQSPAIQTGSNPASWNSSAATNFEYVGQGRITVTGPLTGTLYHFGRGAGPVRVHAADAPSLAGTPGLRAVR